MCVYACMRVHVSLCVFWTFETEGRNSRINHSI